MLTLLNSATVPLYLGIIALATAIAFASYQKGEEVVFADGTRQVTRAPKIRPLGLVLTFLTLFPLLAFSTAGMDHETYNLLFESAKDWDFCVNYHQMEIGFSLINLVLRCVTSDVVLYNCILAFAFLALVLSTFYRLRDKIHFGWGVMAFTCIFYLQYLNLKRIYLAAAILFAAIPWLLNKEYAKYVLAVFGTTLLHTSAIVMFVPLLIGITVGKKLNYKVLGVLAILGFAGLYFLRELLVRYSLSSRYEGYGIIDAPMGIRVALYHLPVLGWFLWQGNPDKHTDTKWCYIFLMCSFVISGMGYFIELIGRMFVYFLFPFAFVPSMGRCYEGYKDRLFNVNKRKAMWIWLITAGYFACRLGLYFLEMYVDGILPYKNIFGWIF